MRNAQEEIELLYSFDPIFVTENNRTTIFAKQKGRLFRISYSFSKPHFFVVSPTAIVPMTSEDVSAILDNFTGFDIETRQKLDNLPKMFSVFKTKPDCPGTSQAPFIYKKMCDEIVQNPAYDTLFKLTQKEVEETSSKGKKGRDDLGGKAKSLTALPEKKSIEQPAPAIISVKNSVAPKAKDEAQPVVVNPIEAVRKETSQQQTDVKSPAAPKEQKQVVPTGGTPVVIPKPTPKPAVDLLSKSRVSSTASQSVQGKSASPYAGQEGLKTTYKGLIVTWVEGMPFIDGYRITRVQNGESVRKENEATSFAVLKGKLYRLVSLEKEREMAEQKKAVELSLQPKSHEVKTHSVTAKPVVPVVETSHAVSSSENGSDKGFVSSRVEKQELFDGSQFGAAESEENQDTYSQKSQTVQSVEPVKAAQPQTAAPQKVSVRNLPQYVIARKAIDSFSEFAPVLIEQKGRSFVFLKQDNNLYRLDFNARNPKFYGLSAQRVWPISNAELMGILTSYKEGDDQIDALFEEIAPLFKKFSDKGSKLEQIPVDVFYAEACFALVADEAFAQKYRLTDQRQEMLQAVARIETEKQQSVLKEVQPVAEKSVTPTVAVSADEEKSEMPVGGTTSVSADEKTSLLGVEPISSVKPTQKESIEEANDIVSWRLDEDSLNGFYQGEDILPSWKFANAYEKLKRSLIKRGLIDAAALSQEPQIYCEGVLAFHLDDKSYVISLNPNRYFSSVQRDGSSEYVRLKGQEIPTVLTRLLEFAPAEKREVIATVAGRLDKLAYKRYDMPVYPTVQQVLDMNELSRRADKTVSADIAPTFCADSTIMARYGNTYYRVTISDNPVFESYENGRIRSLRVDEIRKLRERLQNSPAAKELVRQGIPNIQSYFLDSTYRKSYKNRAISLVRVDPEKPLVDKILSVMSEWMASDPVVVYQNLTKSRGKSVQNQGFVPQRTVKQTPRVEQSAPVVVKETPVKAEAPVAVKESSVANVSPIALKETQVKTEEPVLAKETPIKAETPVVLVTPVVAEKLPAEDVAPVVAKETSVKAEAPVVVPKAPVAAEKVSAHESGIERSIADATAFYGPFQSLPMYKAQLELNALIREYEKKHPEEKTNLIRPFFIASDNHLYIDRGGDKYDLISFDPARPLFHSCMGKKMLQLRWFRVENIFDEIFPDKLRREKYLAPLKDIYYEYKTGESVARSRPRNPLPTVEQVLRLTQYKDLLSEKTCLSNIEATICSEQCAIAYWNGVFFRVSLIPDHYRFEAFENGVVRLMKKSEFSLFAQQLKQRYSYGFLTDHQAGCLKRNYNNSRNLSREDWTAPKIQRPAIVADFIADTLGDNRFVANLSDIAQRMLKKEPQVEQVAPVDVYEPAVSVEPEAVIEEKTAPKAEPVMPVVVEDVKAVPLVTDGKSAQPIDLQTFYGTVDALPSWEAFYQIRNLKTTTQGVSSQEQNEIGREPVLYNEGLIVFDQDNAEYMISVNINRPYSYKRDKTSGELVRLPADDVLEVLYPMLLKEKEEVRTAVFEMLDQLNDVVYKPVKQKFYPTVWQVIEKANVSSAKRSKNEPDILPTFCVGSMIVARYDGCYYKAVLSDQPVFEVWENGSVRPMIVNDILWLSADVRKGSAGQVLNGMHCSLRKFFLSPAYRKKFKLPSTDYLHKTDAQTFGESVLSVYQALWPSKRNAPMQRKRHKIESTVVLSKLSLSDELTAAEQFYGSSGLLPASLVEREINDLKRQYMAQISGYADLSLRRLFVASDNCLYVIKNQGYYVISLDPEQPLFLKYKEKIGSCLYREEALDIVGQLFQDSALKDKYVAFFGRLYDNRKKRSQRRSQAPLPTMQQVLEKAKYTALIANAPSLQNIDPVICAEQVIMAKTGAIFYKIHLREPWSFEALENGVKRDMTLAEVKAVFRGVQHSYSSALLKRYEVRDFPDRYNWWRQLAPQDRVVKQSEPNVLPSIVSFLADYAHAGNQIEETELMMTDNHELAQETDNTFMTADLTRQIEIAASFWPDDGSFIDEPVQNEIEQLAASVNDFTAYKPLTYPFVAQDNCLYVKSGADTVVFSVNPEKPYFVRVTPDHQRRSVSATQLKAVLQSLLETETILDDTRKEVVINWYLTALGKLSASFVKGRIGVRTVPTVRQLLAKHYLMALNNHQDYLSDISATICAGGLVCAKKGGVLYKIVLGSKPQYWTYSNGLVRPMTQTEAGMVNRELLYNYDQNWLRYWNANGLKKLYGMPGNIFPSPLAVKALPSAREFFNFNQSRRTMDALLAPVENKTETVSQKGNTAATPAQQGEWIPFGTHMSVSDFLYHPDDVARNWFAMQIGSLKKQLLTGERYPKGSRLRGLSFSVEPTIVENNMLFYRENKSIYFISLDLRSPVFLKIVSKHQTVITPQELILLANQLYPDDLDRRIQVLSYWAGVYHTYKPSTRDYRHDYPTSAQAVEIAQLTKQLKGTADLVLEPTICTGQMVIAHYGGAWYRWDYGENPSFSVLRDGILMKATPEELSAFYQRLRRQYAEVRLTVHALNLRKVEEVEKRLNKFPMIFTKPEQTLSLPDQIFKAFQQTAPQVDLTKEQAHLFLIDREAKQMIETRSASVLFFEDADALPNYRYISKVRELSCQLDPQNQQPLPPIIANDGRLYLETDTHQISLSLDETKPYVGMWRVKDHCNTTLIWNSLFEQIQQAFSQIPPAQVAAIHDRLQQIYKNVLGNPAQRNFAKIEPPRLDQVIALRDLQVKIDPSVAKDTLTPTICAGNILYAQYGSVYHKISLTPPMKFETLDQGQVRAMTEVELEAILSDFSDNVTLRKLKKREIRKAFERQNLNGYVMTTVPEGIQPPKPYQLPDQQTVFRMLTHRLEEICPNFEEYENESEIKALCLDLEVKLKQCFAKNIPDNLKFRPEYAFYGYDLNYPNYDKQIQIETLRRSQARHNPDLKSDENNDYELPMLYGEDGRFHIKKGINHYIVSMNPDKLFFKVRFPTLVERKLSLAELTDILVGEIIDEALATEVRAALPKIYQAYLTYPDRARRMFGEKLPRFDQVEELLSLQTGIAHPDVYPVVCSGGLLCARYDGVYYKITLTDDPTFEALENGSVRKMRADEFNRILNAIRGNRIYKYLKRHQIPSLSSAFYRKRQYENKENQPQQIEKQVEKQSDLSLFETLPSFAQLLVGRKERIDIPAVICSDRMIHARYDGVYFEIPIQDLTQGKAIRSGTVSPLSEEELLQVKASLVAVYDAEFLSRMGVGSEIFKESVVSKVAENVRLSTFDAVETPAPVVEVEAEEVPVVTLTPAVEVKAEVSETAEKSVQVEEVVAAPKKKRGRPRKNPPVEQPVVQTADVSAEETAAPVAEVVAEEVPTETPAPAVEVVVAEVSETAEKPAQVEEVVAAPKKKRGRPRKNPPVEQPVVQTAPVSAEPSKEKIHLSPAVVAELLRKLDEKEEQEKRSRRSVRKPIPVVQKDVDVPTDEEIGLASLLKFINFKNQVVKPVVPLSSLPKDLPFALPDIADVVLDSHFEETGELPSFQYLYRMLIWDTQIKAGKKLSKRTLIDTMEMKPVLCSRGFVASVHDGKINVVSLDASRPQFMVKNIGTKEEQRMPWDDVEQMLSQWICDKQVLEQVVSGLKPVYDQALNDCVNMPMPYVKPSPAEVYQCHWLKHRFDKEILQETGIEDNRFHIPVTICQPNHIVCRRGSIWYRITMNGETADDIVFDALAGANRRMMMVPELNMMLYELRQNKVFGEKTPQVTQFLLNTYEQMTQGLDENRVRMLWQGKGLLNDSDIRQDKTRSVRTKGD